MLIFFITEVTSLWPLCFITIAEVTCSWPLYFLASKFCDPHTSDKSDLRIESTEKRSLVHDHCVFSRRNSVTYIHLTKVIWWPTHTWQKWSVDQNLSIGHLFMTTVFHIESLWPTHLTKVIHLEWNQYIRVYFSLTTVFVSCRNGTSEMWNGTSEMWLQEKSTH